MPTGLKRKVGSVTIDDNSNINLTPGPAGAVVVAPVAAYSGSGSRQGIEADFEVAAGAGSGTESNPKFLAAGMFNIHGADLTKDSNYLAGCIGALAVTGAKGSNYPVAALMGVLFDGAQADAIVLADLDGDDGGAATNARAAFGVAVNNNNVASGVQYGLDLYAEGNAAYTGGGNAFLPSVADIRFSNGQVLAALTTAITANVTTTTLPAGSLGITSNATGVGKLFVSDAAKWQYAAVA